jgi:hypothetical protein
VVVDGDVDVLPADGVPSLARCVGDPVVVVPAATAADALAGAALDPAELLDVDVDKPARPRVFVAERLLEPDPTEPAHPRSLQDPRHGRERHP